MNEQIKNNDELENKPNDGQSFQRFVEYSHQQEDFVSGALAGALTALVGAILWAGITVVTEYQIGYMAIAVGFGVGYAIQYFGKGVSSLLKMVQADLF